MQIMRRKRSCIGKPFRAMLLVHVMSEGFIYCIQYKDPNLKDNRGQGRSLNVNWGEGGCSYFCVLSDELLFKSNSNCQFEKKFVGQNMNICIYNPPPPP